jgi:uncharacterized LabA/DUF88 family protein
MLKNDLHYEMTVFPLGHKTVRCKECGDSRHSYTEKGIDVALATTMLALANNRAFETAILVSGDKDYLETVKAVKQLGMRVEVVSWKRSLSQDLAKESSRNVILLDDLKAEIEKLPDAEIEKLIPEEEEE